MSSIMFVLAEKIAEELTYTVCAPFKPCDLAPTPCGLFSCRASPGLAPPAPQTSQEFSGTSATSVKAGSANPLTSLQCKCPSSPRPSVATPLQRRPYLPTESGLRFPLYSQHALFQGLYISSCQ